MIDLSSIVGRTIIEAVTAMDDPSTGTINEVRLILDDERELYLGSDLGIHVALRETTKGDGPHDHCE